MTLTPTRIKEFEHDQSHYGTEVALFNLLWLKAADDLRDIGVRSLTTRPARRPKPTPRAANRRRP